MKKVLSLILSLIMVISAAALPVSAQAAGIGTVKKVTVVSKTSTSVKLKWKKVKKATGYQIYCSTKKKSGYKKVKTVKKGKTVKAKIKGLKPNKKYFFKVRAVKKKKKGKFSKPVKVKTKKAAAAKETITTGGAISLIEIEDNKTYSYDIDRDGKKDSIIAKTVSTRGKNGGEYGETVRYLYINGRLLSVKSSWETEKYNNISGYDHSDLYIATDGVSNVIINYSVAGTGGTRVKYFYFDKNECTEIHLWDESLSDMSYYFEGFIISGKYLEIHSSPKLHWFNSYDGLKCFDKKWDFDVMQRYTLNNGKFINNSEYPAASKSAKYTSYSEFKTGKTLESIDSGDGEKVNIGDIITVENIVKEGENYYYRIKTDKGYYWFKGNSEIHLYRFEE